MSNPDVFKVTCSPTMYPGYKGGRQFVQNLTSYRQNPRYIDMPMGIIGHSEMEFDVERHVSWEIDDKTLKPSKFSTMINASYRTGWRSKDVKPPTMVEYMERVEALGDFTLRTNRLVTHPACRFYDNPQGNIFTDYLVNKKSGNYPSCVTIGVIQIEPVDTLEQVVEEIIPTSVRYFNELNPDRQLGPDVVADSISEALRIAADPTLGPKCRAY